MSDHWAEEQQKPISVVLRELCAEDDMRLGDIVDRFGRFPHRNAILGRQDTAEEAAFLLQPGSGF